NKTVIWRRSDSLGAASFGAGAGDAFSSAARILRRGPKGRPSSRKSASDKWLSVAKSISPAAKASAYLSNPSAFSQPATSDTSCPSFKWRCATIHPPPGRERKTGHNAWRAGNGGIFRGRSRPADEYDEACPPAPRRGRAFL